MKRKFFYVIGPLWLVNYPHKGTAMGTFVCFFDVGQNKLLNKQLNGLWSDTTWRSCNAISNEGRTSEVIRQYCTIIVTSTCQNNAGRYDICPTNQYVHHRVCAFNEFEIFWTLWRLKCKIYGSNSVCIKSYTIRVFSSISNAVEWFMLFRMLWWHSNWVESSDEFSETRPWDFVMVNACIRLPDSEEDTGRWK